MKNIYRLKYVCILCFSSILTIAQTNLSGIINAYTLVERISECDGLLQVEDASNFTVGMAILVVQMQGAAINQTNTSTFGNITNLEGAGLYERNEITNINGNEIKLKNTLLHNYNTNIGVQLVSIPSYDNASVTNTLAAQAWNGQTGGVLAIEVMGTLNVTGVIDAGGRGFRGGRGSINVTDTCSSVIFGGFINGYFSELDNWRGAQKGEGIADYPNRREAGRGPLANGGGGGNDHKTGGGGGSHHTIGGQGGELDAMGACRGNFPGIGGIALPQEINRIFMGGGGGGGHGNTRGATNGGNGGGIIIIFADRIVGNGIVRAAGQNAADALGDGAGGGGAGGTIVLVANTVTGNILLDVSGGDGGSTDGLASMSCFGPGGGGSGGRIYSTTGNGLTPSILGGQSGTVLNSTLARCAGTSNRATNGFQGAVFLFDAFPQSSIETEPTTQISIARCGQSNANRIEFNFEANNVASFEYSYALNGGAFTNTINTADATFSLNNLQPNDSATVIVRAVTANGCLTANDTLTCFATNCNVTPTLSTNITPSYCLQDVPVLLTATPSGGVFSGAGVDANGFFNPAQAGLGISELVYNFTDSLGCIFNQVIATQVFDVPQAPEITCSNISNNEVTFSWTSTAELYQVSVRVNGFNSGLPQFISSNTFTQRNINPGDAVEISVTAVGGGNCGNSQRMTQTCQANACANQRIEFANFPLEICRNGATAQLEATPLGGRFNGGGINESGLFNPQDVIFPSGAFTVGTTLRYEVQFDVNCPILSDSIDVRIFDIPIAPTVNCESATINSVAFVWSHPSPSIERFNVRYTINNGNPVVINDTRNTRLEVNNLGLNNRVEIQVEAIHPIDCGNSPPAMASCVANPCGVFPITIQGLAPAYCINSGAVQLTATPPNGVFSGVGVEPNGLFRPANANIGRNVIFYTFQDTNGCVYRDSVITEVQDLLPLPNIQCFVSTSDRIVFTWSHPVATTFEYTYLVNGTSFFGPFTTTDTLLVITDLTPESSVEMTLRASDAGACRTTQFSSSVCTTLPCSNNPPTIIDLENRYCVLANAFPLVGNPTGGTFQINGIAATLFDPASLGVGTFEVRYTVRDSINCPQSATRTVEIETPPIIPNIVCGDIDAQSITFTWDNTGTTPYSYRILVNGQTVLTDNTSNGRVVVNDLAPDQDVTIEVFPANATACGMVQTTQTCRTLSCDAPVSVIFNIDPTYCLDDANFEISATPLGGTFSGEGIRNRNIFNPSLAGVGRTAIVYQFADSINCPRVDTFFAEVLTAPLAPAISCGDATLTSVAFNWSSTEIDPNFTFQIFRNNLPLSEPIITDDFNYVANGLMPDQEITIRIQTMGTNGCGDSNISELICTTQPCTITELKINSLAEICLGADTLPQQLTVDLSNAANFINPRWEGNGITDNINGIFDPTASNLILGINEVAFLAEDSLGCPYQATIEVQVNQQPIAMAGDDQLINCENRIARLGVMRQQTATSYRWRTNDGNIIEGLNAPIALVAAEGQYFLEVANRTCIARDSVTVTANLATPIADAGNDQSILCLGDVVTLDARNSSQGTNFTYQWTGPNGFQSNQIAFNTAQAGIYRIVVLDTTNFCNATTTVEVLNNSEDLAARIELTGQNQFNCSDPALTLAARTSSMNRLQYQWAFQDNIVAEFGTQSTLQIRNAGQYRLIVRNENNCSDTAILNVTANFEIPVSEAGENKIISCGETIDLEGFTPSTNEFFTFEWSGPGIVANANTLSPTVDKQGFYILKVVNTLNGCTALDIVEVMIEETSIRRLIVDATPPTCAGNTDGQINVLEVVGGTPPFMYALGNNPFTTNPIFNNLKPGVYIVNVEDIRECTATVELAVEERLPLEVRILGEERIKLGQTVNLSIDVSSSGASLASVLWSAEKLELCSGCSQLRLTPSDNVEVIVDVQDTNGCKATARKQVIVQKNNLVYAPNIFSPNGDGENDYFNLFPGNSVSEIPNLKIYDRWGELVFEQNQLDFNNPQTGWNGTYKGVELNPSVYLYVAQVVYIDGRKDIIYGEFTLVR